MMAVTAAGQLLPSYVVYKSVYLYPTCIEGGPDGTAKDFEESSDHSEQEAAENPSNEELREEGNSVEPKTDLDNEINFYCIQPGYFLLVKFSCQNNAFKYFFGCVSDVDAKEKMYYVNFLGKNG